MAKTADWKPAADTGTGSAADFPRSDGLALLPASASIESTIFSS